MKVVPADERNLERAAAILRKGGLVIIPTETVYGVACDATNASAVRRLYEAKGRPTSNPLIVHVATIQQAKKLASRWPKGAELLARAFWPGPLTLVVKRSVEVPAETAAGLDTVALRMPNHPVAQEIIRTAGLALAAPSANRYMRLSPTRVEHLDPKLVNKVDLVLDGGSCGVGIESTVIDLSTAVPRLLRPGGLERQEIERVLGRMVAGTPPDGPARSPGMNNRHYAPRARLRLVDVLDEAQTGLTFDEPQSAKQIKMPEHPQAYAAALFDALHFLDKLKPSTIFVESPPEEPAWEAVWDRLKRASTEL